MVGLVRKFINLENNTFGAPKSDLITGIIQNAVLKVQTTGSYFGQTNAGYLESFVFSDVDTQTAAADEIGSWLWLAEDTPPVAFQAYYVPLKSCEASTALDTCALEDAYAALQVLKSVSDDTNDFFVSLPVELRFVKASDNVLLGATNPSNNVATDYMTLDDWDRVNYYVQIEMLAYPQNYYNNDADTTIAWQSFFGSVEEGWVKLGEMPHNAKMHCFYDPSDFESGNYNAPFLEGCENSTAKNGIWESRINKKAQFESYRSEVGPSGLFCNEYTNSLFNCSDATSSDSNTTNFVSSSNTVDVTCPLDDSLECASGSSYTLTIGSNGSSDGSLASWPGGLAYLEGTLEDGTSSDACSTVISLPDGNISTLTDSSHFSVLSGKTKGFTSCSVTSCSATCAATASVSSCGSNRPNCTIGADNDATATVTVQCD